MTTIEVSTPPAEPILDERELFHEWIRQTRWTDEAYLVLETLSSTTSHLDLGEKFAEYARAGIAEYWMADPQARRVSVFSLEGTDYKLLAHFGPGERARSQLLAGLEIAVDDLFDADRAAPAADSSSQSSA